MPKIINHDEYRRQLLNQCFGLFAEYGYASLSMRQIAGFLGVSTGTLYHYFPNKLAMFEQLLILITEEDIAFGSRMMEISGVEDRLRAFFTHVFESEERFMRKFMILHEYIRQEKTGAVPEQHSAIQRTIGEYIRLCEQLVGDRKIGVFMLAVIHGLLIQRYINGAATSYEEQAELAVDMILRRVEEPSENHSRLQPKAP